MIDPKTLDEETIKWIERYTGSNWKSRPVKVEVLSEDGYGVEKWSLAEFSKLYSQAVSQIPEAYRDKAEVELNDGDGCYCRLTIRYTRPENEEEFQRRLQRYLHEYREEKEREYRNFLELKAKFQP